jgi:hypothetical protein
MVSAVLRHIHPARPGSVTPRLIQVPAHDGQREYFAVRPLALSAVPLSRRGGSSSPEQTIGSISSDKFADLLRYRNRVSLRSITTTRDPRAILNTVSS